MHKRIFVLPTGQVTRSALRYAQAYRKLARPIGLAFKAKLAAFDPGISLVGVEGKHVDWSRRHRFADYEAIVLYQIITGNEYTC